MVKLEGGAPMLETVAFLTRRGIPVCGHLGLTPQSVHQLGGYQVQGSADDDGRTHAAKTRATSKRSGAGMIVLEAIPAAARQAR